MSIIVFILIHFVIKLRVQVTFSLFICLKCVFFGDDKLLMKILRGIRAPIGL